METFSIYISVIASIALAGVLVYVFYQNKQEQKQQENIREAEQELTKLLGALQTIKEKKAEDLQPTVKEVKQEAVSVDTLKDSVSTEETPKQAPKRVKKIYPKKSQKPRSNKRK